MNDDKGLILTSVATQCSCGGQVEQAPGWGHCVVRCQACHRDGIRTWRLGTGEPHVTWMPKAGPEAVRDERDFCHALDVLAAEPPRRRRWWRP